MRIIKKRIWITALALLIPYIFILVICIKRTNEQAILPGGLTKVSSLIDVQTDYEEKGSFNTTYVFTYSNTTIFQNFILNNDDKLGTTSNDAYLHLSNEEIKSMNSLSKDSSVLYSIIEAYETASNYGHNVSLSYKEAGIRIYYRKKDQQFKINDHILKINGISYSDEKAYLDEFVNQQPGTVFTVKRGNEILEITLTEKESPKKGYVSYLYYRMYDIDYENAIPKIIVNKNNVGGPSGGLLQALAIYNRITEFDYTYGLTIAGTGTIDVNGNIGQIGGIKQKIFTAFKNDVDIFFCPEENYAEALEAYNTKKKSKMALVCVKTFEDAIKYLEDLNV